ncbi:MFS transporter [Paraburkholderia sp. ZP32-5]|uniref:MFS transporter n=1 Tax=Paraburkholderia sp. ZP32-5 TaxID=2883245 RepID=UPI001F2F649F|nr:MFS transporter [Paraburkholderia sp. ZP32-5]
MKAAEAPRDWPAVSSAYDDTSGPGDTLTAKARWRIFFASFLGTMVEWYDFFLYGFLAPLVFEELFFPKLNPMTAVIAVYATFAVGYASRPLGGLVFGHFGDRIGRKSMMQITLLMMGLGTALMGLLPTAAQLGVTATGMLVVLRFLQGFALGGESAASALMVLESAQKKHRGLLGGLLQCAGPVGVLLASLTVYLVTHMERSAMLSWGWRVPFLMSAVLVVIGLYIRTRVEETATFRKQDPEVLKRVPLFETLRDYKWPAFVVLAVSVMESTFYYLTSVYPIAYVTRTLHMPGSVAIGAIAAAHAFTLLSSPLYGAISDRVGRKGVYLLGIVASTIYINFFFGILDTKSPLYITLAVIVAIGIVHAPMYALFGSFYGELFPTRVRFTGYSLGKAVGTMLGGGIAPMIAATLVAAHNGNAAGIGFYYLGPAVVALIAVVFTRETRDTDIAR